LTLAGGSAYQILAVALVLARLASMIAWSRAPIPETTA
jgi:hypothetical protein